MRKDNDCVLVAFSSYSKVFLGPTLANSPWNPLTERLGRWRCVVQLCWPPYNVNYDFHLTASGFEEI
jgi:hypothetical protein